MEDGGGQKWDKRKGLEPILTSEVTDNPDGGRGGLTSATCDGGFQAGAFGDVDLDDLFSTSGVDTYGLQQVRIRSSAPGTDTDTNTHLLTIFFKLVFPSFKNKPSVWDSEASSA